MDREQLERSATPESLARAVEQQRDSLALLHHAHDAGTTSVREFTYLGHDVRIVTTYDITVDGVPVTGHLLVSNEGTIHYHAIPNQEFASAVDMVRRIIDLSPGSFPPPTGGTGTPGHQGHEGHGAGR